MLQPGAGESDMPISYIYTGQPMTGTANDDFFIGYKGSTGTDNNTINAGGGDDWVMADSTDTWIPNASYLNGSIANAFNLETLTSAWSTSENPLFGNSAVPHTTAIVETTIGQSEFFRVAVGAGETITIDIDYGSNTATGVTRDLVVELMDSLGNIIATADDSLVSDGGFGSFPSSPGSVSSRDPYLTYTVATAGTYYINVRPFGGSSSTFTENNTFVMNVSITGHATAASNAVGGVDNINGEDGDDSLFGQGGNDVINGGSGNDFIHGGSGGDIIHGGDGNDTIYGGEGSEENAHGDGGNDILYSGGEGHYYGDDGDDLIYAGLTAVINEVLDGGAGIDTLDTTSWNGTYDVNLVTGVTNFGESFINFENIVTGSGDDTIVGTAGANVIQSGEGNDSLDGRGGADTLAGGGGNDTYRVDNASDKITEAAGGGSDRVYASVSYQLAAGAEVEILNTSSNGGTGAINLVGNNFVQTIVGNAGNNIINGLGGADLMQGLGGNDRYHVDNSADIIVEVAGGGSDRVLTSVNYSLKSGVEVEILSTTNAAGTANLKLAGNSYANAIVGNAGANFINGGLGADTLTGLGGKDTFMFSTAIGSPNVDTITDFNVVDDTIRLENGIFTAISGTGMLTAAQFVKNTTGLAQDSSDRIIYETDTGKLFYDANGSASGGRLHFATLEKNLGLTAGDFFIV
jgi:Ca2+-binding RTX toxin-like protein